MINIKIKSTNLMNKDLNTAPLLPVLNDQESFSQAFKELNFSEIGVKEADYEKVMAACDELGQFNQTDVSFFGQGLALKTQNHTDELLKLVQSKDIDSSGQKLNQVLKVAKGLNAKSLVSKKGFFSRGLVGRILGTISLVKEDFVANFNNVKEQLDSLMSEISESQTGLNSRISMLEKMHHTVGEEYTQLGIYVAAGELKRKELALIIQDLSNQQAEASDNLISAKIFDLNAVANSLEKRIHDLRVLQHSANQTMPMIRIIQTNNAMLVDKFNAIKTVTLPAWKNQFTLAISLNEQKSSVELATAVDDATNDLLRSNADLLKSNSIDTAKANQRAVIDIETLQYVQDSLMTTIEDVSKIQREGMQFRDESTEKLKQMQKDMSITTLSNAANNNQRMIS